MKDSITFIGYIHNEETLKNLTCQDDIQIVILADKYKGTQKDWTHDGAYPKSWPPKKVEITVTLKEE
jgi:hypothetical protein